MLMAALFLMPSPEDASYSTFFHRLASSFLLYFRQHNYHKSLFFPASPTKDSSLFCRNFRRTPTGLRLLQREGHSCTTAEEGMYDNLENAGHDELVTKYAPLVKRIAYHLKARLPATVVVDDLLQAGMIGLLEASRKYDANQGASFETYAGIRIRGSMLDELRRNDWAPKSVHRKIRDITQAIRSIEHREGRDARDEEVIEELGISRDEYFKTLQDVSSHRVLSWDEIGVDEDAFGHSTGDNKTGVHDQLEKQHFQAKLSDAISSLPEREKMIVSLYYESELNLREIGSVMNVSESRISQLLSQAHIRLRARMRDWIAQQ